MCKVCKKAKGNQETFGFPTDFSLAHALQREWVISHLSYLHSVYNLPENTDSNSRIITFQGRNCGYLVTVSDGSEPCGSAGVAQASTLLG